MYLDAYDCISLAREAIRLSDDLGVAASSSSVVELNKQLDEPVSDVSEILGVGKEEANGTMEEATEAAAVVDEETTP
jgi:hypothetical protein